MSWSSSAVFAVELILIAGMLIFFLNPALTLRLILLLLRCTLLRLRTDGKENIPASGPVLLVANHVSLIDLLLIQSLTPRPVRFMIRQEVIDALPLLRFLFWYLGVIFSVLGIVMSALSVMANPAFIVTLVVFLVMLLYLFKDNVKLFFLK